MSSSLILITKKKFDVPKTINLRHQINDLPTDFSNESIYLSALGQEEFVLNGWFSEYNRYCFEQSYIKSFEEYKKVEKGHFLWHSELTLFLDKLLDFFIEFLRTLIKCGDVFLVEVWQGNKSQYKWDKKLDTRRIRTKDDDLFNVVTKTVVSLSDLQKNRTLSFIRNNIIEIVE